jgi:hypothetical protein
MKMVKSLLLGTAAGLVAVAGAQAADMPVKAKPVQYVKICTLYGEGFYYIPGSDTCIRVGGYVRADYGWNVRGARTPTYSGGSGGFHTIQTDEYSTRHRFRLDIDTRTQTAYGTLRTLGSVNIDDQDQGTIAPAVTRAMIQFAGFTFGKARSYADNVFFLGDALTYFSPQNESDTAAAGVNQIAYTLELGGGTSLTFGADERAANNRTRALANMSAAAVRVGAEPTSSRAGERYPNPYVAFKIEQAWGSWGAAILFQDNRTTYFGAGGCPVGAQAGTSQCGYTEKVGWGVNSGGRLNLPMIGAGDYIGYYFNYSEGHSGVGGGNLLSSPAMFGSGNTLAWGLMTDAVYVDGGTLQLTTAWTFGAGFEHNWSPLLKTSLYGSYSEISYNTTARAQICASPGTNVSGVTNCDPNWKFWTVGSRTQWSPARGFILGVDVIWTQIDTAFEGTGLINNSGTNIIGGRPTGAYTFSDQGTLSVTGRAQRNY